MQEKGDIDKKGGSIMWKEYIIQHVWVMIM